MKKTHVYIAISSISFVVSAYFESFFTQPNARVVGIIHLFVLAVMAFAWCKAHVAENDIVEPRGSAALCGLMVIPGVPIYFYRAFGFKVGSLYLAAFMLVLLAWVILYATASYLFNSFL